MRLGPRTAYLFCMVEQNQLMHGIPYPSIESHHRVEGQMKAFKWGSYLERMPEAPGISKSYLG